MTQELLVEVRIGTVLVTAPDPTPRDRQPPRDTTRTPPAYEHLRRRGAWRPPEAGA